MFVCVDPNLFPLLLGWKTHSLAVDNIFDIVSLHLLHTQWVVLKPEMKGVKSWRLKRLTMWNGPVKAGREGEEPVLRNIHI